MYPNQPYTPATGQHNDSAGQSSPLQPVDPMVSMPADPMAMPLPPQPIGTVPQVAAPLQPEQSAAADPNIAWLPPTVPVQPSADPSSQNAAGQASQGGSAAVPNIADDGDLIEKEWVNGVKAIVMRTRQDPYLQTKELHKFKAEYMKKRYNKIIEAVEE